MKTSIQKNQHGFAHIVLVLLMVVAVVGVGALVYQRTQQTKTTSSTSSVPATTTKAAKAPSIIKTVEFSTSVDSAGKATAPVTTFSPTDGKINVVLTLQNPKKGTKIEFVRYRDSKFVDNGSLTIAKDGAQYASFDFTPKSGKQHPIGNYKMKIYVNGSSQTSGTYSVK